MSIVKTLMGAMAEFNPFDLKSGTPAGIDRSQSKKEPRPDKFPSKAHEHAYDAKIKTGVYVRIADRKHAVDISPEAILETLGAAKFKFSAGDIRELQDIETKIAPLLARWETFHLTAANIDHTWEEDQKEMLKPDGKPRFESRSDVAPFLIQNAGKIRRLLAQECEAARQPLQRMARGMKSALEDFAEKEIKAQIFATAEAHRNKHGDCDFHPTRVLETAEYLLSIIDATISVPIAAWAVHPFEDSALFGVPKLYIARLREKK